MDRRLCVPPIGLKGLTPVLSTCMALHDTTNTWVQAWVLQTVPLGGLCLWHGLCNVWVAMLDLRCCIVPCCNPVAY